MIFLHNRLASSFCLGMVLLSFGFVSSCKTNPPDAREELVRSLKGADVNGYLFATKEEDDQIITSLTNGALRQPVKLDSTHSLVIGYASVKDKKTNAVKTLKAEIIKTGSTIALHVTDLGSGGLPTKFDFPNPIACAPEHIFNTSQDCFDDYNCRIFPGLLREANRDCKIRLFGLECCFKDGTAFEALMIIRPTERRCLVAFPFDIDTVTLSP